MYQLVSCDMVMDTAAADDEEEEGEEVDDEDILSRTDCFAVQQDATT